MLFDLFGRLVAVTGGFPSEEGVLSCWLVVPVLGLLLVFFVFFPLPLLQAWGGAALLEGVASFAPKKLRMEGCFGSSAVHEKMGKQKGRGLNGKFESMQKCTGTVHA